jgi:hypothetical protein
MAKRTLNGFLGVLILPEPRVAHAATQLTEDEGVGNAEYRVKPEGVHITLFQSRDFKDLPVGYAKKLVAKLNESLISNPAGELLMYFLDVKPYTDNEQYLFWNVDRTKKNQRLVTAHGMSLSLSAWVQPRLENEYKFGGRLTKMSPKQGARERKLRANTTVFGHTLVAEDYLPHITIAADSNGFNGFKPRQEAFLGSANCVVLARMGEWGKIDEILI